MAHKKGAGSTDNGRDSKPKYLGVKLFGGQSARAGNIIVRQRGTKFHAGDNTYLGKDHSLHAKIDGIVVYTTSKNDKKTVHIKPFPAAVSEVLDVAVAPKVAAKKAAPAPKVAEKVAAVAPKVVKAPAAVVAEPVVETVIETPIVVAESVAEAVVEMAAPVVADVVEETVVEVAAEPVAEKKVVAKKGPKQDDLKIVEGIGPKIEQLLHEGDIKTWLELSETPIERLKEILDAAGSRYQMHDPATWPKQAQFAHEGRFDELKEWQEMLDGGRNKED